MPDEPRKNADDLREAAKLIVQATTGVTDVVEKMHERIASGPAVLGKPLSVPARLITTVAYGSVRGVTRLVGKTIDRVLEQLTPFLGESTPSVERDAVLAALNGVLGDWLAETKSPFALEMRLIHEKLGPKTVVFIHGSSMNHHQWNWKGHHHGEALAKDEGWTPVYVHYNSGLPIAENGRLLSAKLEALFSEHPIDELAIVAHSMGGLVARVACTVAEKENHAWRPKLKKLITLGTPHQGSPLERGGSIIDLVLPLSSYSAPLARLGKIRSAGVTDLRHGLATPLPEGVECFAVAAAGDVLVPVASAHGAIPEDRRSIVTGASHVDLLGNAEVYETIRSALRVENPK